MIRFTIRTLAVAAGLFAGVGSTFAVDPAQNLGRYKPGDDKKAVAPAAAADDDTEQIRHRGRYGYGYSNYYRPYYGGYSGGFGRSYYGGGFSYGYSSFYAPRYYTPTYYYAPPVYYYSTPSYYGGFCGINDTEGAVTLNLSLKPTAAREPQRALPSPIEPGTFRYDGGPSQVVPQPTPEAKPMPKAEPAPAVEESLKISLKPPTAAKPTPRYKAYGEK